MTVHFKHTRPTVFIARDAETGEVVSFASRDEAFAFWRNERSDMDFMQLDPDFQWSPLNDDFEDEDAGDARFARSLARHERSYSRPA